jgi:hypothetical protein
MFCCLDVATAAAVCNAHKQKQIYTRITKKQIYVRTVIKSNSLVFNRVTLQVSVTTVIRIN